jgi:small subunit ribosomal protein S27e
MLCLQENIRTTKRIPRKKARIRLEVLLMTTIREPTSKFIKIRCPKCKNEQIMFGKAVTNIPCLVCNKILAEPSGGKSRIKARILEVLE